MMDLQPAITELKAEQARIEKAIQALKDLQALRECREEWRLAVPAKPVGTDELIGRLKMREARQLSGTPVDRK